MHRNTYINSPRLLLPTLQLKKHPHLLMAGQITGVEGYMESAATGILAGINAVRLARGQEPHIPGNTTMLGALVDFICHSDAQGFQPINANFGLLPPIDHQSKDKKLRNEMLVGRALHEMSKFSELFA
jgi:methylenetetrahydrofolate--tRNA-(uracil-5-)-methyltransferase